MFGLNRRIAVFAVFVLQLALLCACQKNTPPSPVLPTLSVGVVGVTQPTGTTDLLAGFIPENRVLATPKALTSLNEAIMGMLKAETKRTYRFISEGSGVDPTLSRSAGHNGALAHWVQVGRDAKVDLLIVPQLLNWHERAGSGAGVTTAAEVNIDFFLIDVREKDGELLSRSHFKEKQVGLSDNFMNFDTFIKRGGKWLSAQDLALEAVQKMIKEFGL
ncbi:MAG: nucleoid-structuring protein H-NS [Bilophila sp.]